MFLDLREGVVVPKTLEKSVPQEKKVYLRLQVWSGGVSGLKRGNNGAHQETEKVVETH